MVLHHHPRSLLSSQVLNLRARRHLKAPSKIDAGGGNNNGDPINSRVEKWCIMSPSNQRLRELASVVNTTQVYGEDTEASNEKKQKSGSYYQRMCKAFPYFNTEKDAHVNILPVASLQRRLRTGIVDEEMQEFEASEFRVIKFPDYFSNEDQLLLEAGANKWNFGYLKCEKYLMVYKAGLLPHSLSNVSPNTISYVTKCDEDVVVNVPELASLGHESFLRVLRLTRMDSGTDMTPGKRIAMLWEANKSSQEDMNSYNGVYAMRANGADGIVFKPMEEEKFVREGLEAGEGAIREEAAYVLDSAAGGFSGVPPTAVAHLNLPDKAKSGAVQRFTRSKMGSLEEFGMSKDLNIASQFVPVREIHKVGILDIRLFNTDRHTGNLLLVGDKAPYTLVPIDHGCILPSWFHLAEARFDWSGFPQADVPFSEEMLNRIKRFDSQKDAVLLRKLGIREECVTTMRMSTMFLQVAAEHGKTLKWIADVMQRKGCLQSPSEFEVMTLQACTASSIPFRFISNDYNEESGVIEPGIFSRRLPKCTFAELERLFRKKCKQ